MALEPIADELRAIVHAAGAVNAIVAGVDGRVWCEVETLADGDRALVRPLAIHADRFVRSGREPDDRGASFSIVPGQWYAHALDERCSLHVWRTDSGGARASFLGAADAVVSARIATVRARALGIGPPELPLPTRAELLAENVALPGLSPAHLALWRTLDDLRDGIGADDVVVTDSRGHRILSATTEDAHTQALREQLVGEALATASPRLARGGSIDWGWIGPQSIWFARSFAGAYLALAWWRGQPMAPLLEMSRRTSEELFVRELPRIEQLTLALPPDGGGVTHGAAALRARGGARVSRVGSLSLVRSRR